MINTNFKGFVLSQAFLVCRFEGEVSSLKAAPDTAQNLPYPGGKDGSTTPCGKLLAALFIGAGRTVAVGLLLL
jgi:hypothetical protein